MLCRDVYLPGVRRPRGGFTITETVIALGILGLVLTLMMGVSLTVLRERFRVSDRQAAQELAANVLESARACPWEDLSGTWASAQRLPGSFLERGWRLEVRVEPEKGRPLVKRVTAAVHWRSGGNPPDLSVELAGLFSGRDTTAPKGGKP